MIKNVLCAIVLCLILSSSGYACDRLCWVPMVQAPQQPVPVVTYYEQPVVQVVRLVPVVVFQPVYYPVVVAVQPVQPQYQYVGWVRVNR